MDNLQITHFNISIKSYNQKINIQTLINNFELDCSIDPSNTFIIYNNSLGPRPLGYIQLQYKKDLINKDFTIQFDTTLISIPPIGPIPPNTWCNSCNYQHPQYHDKECPNPYESSLLLLENGTRTNIPYTDNPKDKKIWPNCAILKYNFNTKSVSVRIYEDSTIAIIACPWEYPNFYEELIDRLSDSKSVVDKDGFYKYEILEILINSVFSIFYINSTIKLEYLYNHLTSIAIPMIKEYKNGNKEQHNYLNVENTFYRFLIEYQTNKVILKLIPCVNNKNDILYCKPYKITAIIFTSGAIELTFSHCSEKNLCDIGQYQIPHELKEQHSEIQNELYAAKEFITKLIENQKYLTPKEPPEDLAQTVTGTNPYKKPKNIYIDEEVEIWDPTLMNFTQKATIEDVTDDGYIINDNTYQLRDLRPTSGHPMKLSAEEPTENDFFSSCKSGKQYHIPFGGTQSRDNLFHPKCEKFTANSKELYLSQILEGFPLTTQDKETFLIEPTSNYDTYSGVFRKGTIILGAQILTKLPNNQELLNRTTPEAIRYFNSNRDSEGFIQGKIVDYEKTKGKVLDNYIIYHIRLDNDDILYVTGSDFHPMYRQDRRWSGISGTPEEVKEKLIRCTEKLGLSQSPFTSERLQKELANNIWSQVCNLVGNPPFKKTIVLSPTLLTKFTKTPYVAFTIPQNAIRSLLYITENATYCIINQDKIIEFSYNSNRTLIIDGWVIPTNWSYIPLDYIWPSKSKDYISELIKTNTLYKNVEEFKQATAILKGRLFLMNEHITNLLRQTPKTKRFLTILSPFNFASPTLDPQNPWLSASRNDLIIDLSKKLKDDDIIIFIPQSGKGSWLAWQQNLKTSLILSVTKDRGRSPYGTVTIPVLGEHKVKVPSAIAKNQWLRFLFNFRSNGTIDPDEPIILDTSNPISSHGPIGNQEAIVRTLLNPIPIQMFRNPTEWIFQNIHLRSQGGTKPLISTN